MQHKKTVTLFIVSITMLALIIFQFQQATAHFEVVDTGWQTKVDGWVLETASLPNQETEFLVFLTEQADLSGAAQLQSKEEKGQYVYDRLTAVSAQTQAPLIAALEADDITYQSFWITNMILVRGDAAVVQKMASRADVAHIYANPTVHLNEPERIDMDAINDAIEEVQTIEWNIAKVGAPDVWAMGYDGTGIVVGGQDTGYDWDHPALINQYRGWDGTTADHDYNWHDSIHTGGGVCGPDSPEPCDDHGHGTHTMGTMVGDDGGTNQVGMAPGAKWIGCRNMNVGDGSPATYSECYQWFIAPTQMDGTNANPAMAPHIINNSWSCPVSEGCTNPNIMLTIVDNVVAAGIITVHSAGNSGSSCSSISDPSAIYDASYTVGATDSSDTIAGFSSRGSVTIDGSGRMKPDISAPGVNIRSSTRGGGYAGGWNGTSMAGPHVAGAIALLLQQTPSLIGDSAAVEALLNQTAVPRTTTQTCGGVAGSEIPNNTYGWGRFDILAAVNNITTTEQHMVYLPIIHKPEPIIANQITMTTINLPATLEGSAGSWCTWGGCTIGPRLYHAPLLNGDSLIGWTDVNGNGHVSLVSNSGQQQWNFPNTAIRGLISHNDGSFAILRWDRNADIIWLSKHQSNGTESWKVSLNSDIARAEFWLGDGRLEYGNGQYAAYFTVKGTDGGFTGHYGDQLTYVSDAGIIQPEGWNWGCSHSMAQLVTYHPALDEFAAVCSADCYPDKSIHWVNASQQIYQGDGNCGGIVSTQLGQMAVAAQTWKLVFNAQEQPCCDGNGIALATLDDNQQASYVWLTNTNGEYERDPAIARIGANINSGHYLVGWTTTNDNVFWLGVINDNGQFLKGPDNVSTTGVRWGNRDESFRTRTDGTISWVQADANGNQIRLYHFDGTPFLP